MTTTKKRKAPTPPATSPDIDRWDDTVKLHRGLGHQFSWRKQYLRGEYTFRAIGTCDCGVVRYIYRDDHGRPVPGSRYDYTGNPEYLARHGRVAKSDVLMAWFQSGDIETVITKTPTLRAVK